MNNDTSTPTPEPRAVRARHAWLAAGGLTLAGVGLAAGLAWHPSPQSELLAPGSMDATRASLASNEAVVDPSAKAGDKAQAKTGAPVPKAATAHHAAASATPSATVCAHCGVIEGVREVKQKGKGTGVGVVAGGVVGGALGNQVGKGSGRTVMTVLGAIGGGLAGNEIEKRARSETAYEVRVRMDDGSLRTLQQKTAPKAGTRVTIEGNALHTVHAPAAQSPTLRPSAGT